MLTRMRRAGTGRRLGAGLILLALWLQGLAPAASLRMIAAAQGPDALTHAVICGRDTGPADLAAEPTGPALPACDHCPFCRCTAAAPIPTPPEPAIWRLTWHPVAWPTPPPGRMHRPPRLIALARAPPGPV